MRLWCSPQALSLNTSSQTQEKPAVHIAALLRPPISNLRRGREATSDRKRLPKGTGPRALPCATNLHVTPAAIAQAYKNTRLAQVDTPPQTCPNTQTRGSRGCVSAVFHSLRSRKYFKTATDAIPVDERLL